MFRQFVTRQAVGVSAAALLVAPTAVNAQGWDYVNPIPAGTTVEVRTTEKIDTQIDGRTDLYGHR